MEPPFVHFAPYYDKDKTDYFGKIFTFYDDLVDNIHYFKFYHEQYNEKFVENVPCFENKKLCVMIHNNHFVHHPNEGYSDRRQAVNYFQNKDELDVYGSRWDGFSGWKGVLPDGKIEMIKNYKFCLCYESARNQYGCISNKLLDVFWAKSVPIYHGPLNVNDYIPKECFINLREFSSYEDVSKFMKSIDKKTYDNYIEAAQSFLNDPKSDPFKPKEFGELISKHISEKIVL